MKVSAPVPPLPLLSLGVTGHRESNEAFSANRDKVATELNLIFNQVEAVLAEIPYELAPIRFHSLLAEGVDQVAAESALARGWELVAPLPFGRDLNRAVNADPRTPEDVDRLLAGEPVDDPAMQAKSDAIGALEARAKLFELADQDQALTHMLKAMLARPDKPELAQLYHAHKSDQVELAARVMIEQCDLIIGVWDGKFHNLGGGTGHTISTALALGAPVLLINPSRTEHWSIFATPEALAHHSLSNGQDTHLLKAIIKGALHSEDDLPSTGPDLLQGEKWHGRSSPFWIGYRAIEKIFGQKSYSLKALVQTYERPDQVAEGSGKHLLEAGRAIPGSDRKVLDGIAEIILPQFAWADGISTWLSDAYRSGMVANFLLASLAVLAGLAYQPLHFDDHKWVFASLEFLLLGNILLITWFGARKEWHSRWFDTRRIAEYLRHAPVMMMLGVARPPGRWPRGKGANWPEYHARLTIRAVGLPEAVIDRDYLRSALENLLRPHVTGQRDYHRVKSKRLENVHDRLDGLAEKLFIAAVISVTIYLALEGAAALGALPKALPYDLAKLFTFLGVAFPTLGASIAAIRYFGDFERFAAISQVTAEKLDAIAHRIQLLLDGPKDAIDYGAVAELAHAIDEVVVNEIESWQAVFGGKHIALPA
ncbi:MAG TPA: hypothetical protein VLA37_13025 [Sphingomonadaceae bacterium]|nr:hypothetical protein [Sphingomonadaceae bacterium]